MARLDIRMNDELKSKLDKLSAKTGYSSSELIRMLIENANEVTLSLALDEIKNRKLVDLQKIANDKYTNYLLSNLTKNVNQIAHWCNANQYNNVNKELQNYLKIFVQNTEEIKKKLSDKSGNS